MFESSHDGDEGDPDGSLAFCVAEHAEIGLEDVLSDHVDEPDGEEGQKEY